MIEQGLYFAAGVKESAKDSNQNTEIQEESEGESRRSSRSGSGFVLKNLKKNIIFTKISSKNLLSFFSTVKFFINIFLRRYEIAYS